MKTTITQQIEETAFRLLENNVEGIQWSQLNRMIKESNPTFHPKTINGTIWKLTHKYPNKVSKNNGLLRLIK